MSRSNELIFITVYCPDPNLFVV